MTPHTRPAILACLLWTTVSLAQSDIHSDIRPLETSVRSGTATTDQQKQLVQLYIAAGRYYEASKLVARLALANPDDTAIVALREEAARGMRDVNDKLVTEAEARARAKGATDADRLALADAYFNAGSYGAAAAAYAALPASQLNRDAHLRHARALSWSGQLDNAEKVYTSVIREGSDPALDLEYGTLLSWMGASKASLTRLEQLYAANPTEPTVLALANARAWNSNREGAIQLLDDYVARNPGAANAVKLRAELSASPDLRIERVDRQIAAEPHNLALRMERARLLLDAERYSEAIRTLKFVRDHSAAGVEGLDELERITRERRDVEYARIREQRGALSMTSADSTGEMLSLAKAYTGVEAYDEAIDLYRRYLDERPDDLDARIAYARVLSWDRRWDAADREYRRILTGNPERADLRLEHAQVLSYDRDYVKAIRTFRSLTDISDNSRAHLYPDVPQRAHFNLGQIYRWYGWNDHAVEQQNRAIAIDSSYMPPREELDIVRHLRPASSIDARYSYNTDSNDFSLRRIDLTADVWRSQRTAFQAAVGRHHFEHGSESVDANVLSGGLTHRMRDRFTARGRVGAAFYGDDLGTRPFFGIGAEYLPDVQSRVTLDYNHYDLVYDVFTLSSLTNVPTQTTSLRDPISIDDFRTHYDYNSGGVWSFLADASHGFISDDNTRTALHGLLAFRIFRSPFVALKADGRWLSYDERTNRYWSPTDYKSLAGVLHVGHNFGERLFLDGEVKYGRSWDGDRESDLRTMSAKATIPLTDALDLVGHYGYGKSGRLESVFGNNGEDFVNYWQRNWYVGVRVKRLFARGDREGRTPYYYDNRVLMSSPLVAPVGETR